MGWDGMTLLSTMAIAMAMSLCCFVNWKETTVSNVEVDHLEGFNLDLKRQSDLMTLKRLFVDLI
jgi:NADH:ubiquinone oxidoreductase subunit B-like Fe-S oxidoreductase